MKALLPAVILTSIAALAGAADAASVGGTWKVHNSIAGHESDMTCTLSTEGADLRGTCATPETSVDVTGTVDGPRVTWVYKSEYNGSPITLTYTGILEADRLEGTVMVQEYFTEGRFTATRPE
jgi:hypothetical protein